MGYSTKHSKEQIAEALDRGQNNRITNNGWEKLISSISSPINLGDLKTPGNYTILFWTDGPNLGTENITPLNVTVVKVDGVITQFINVGGKFFQRSIPAGETNYGNWKIDTTEGSINPGPEAPGSPVNGETVWIDTSDINSPLFKLYINGEWKVINPEGVMLSDIYDTQNKNSDIFKYINDVIDQSSVGEITETVNNHIKDTTIHVTSEEKQKWKHSATEEYLDQYVNNFKNEMNTKSSEMVTENESEVDTLNTEINTLKENIDNHTANTTIHPFSSKQSEWDNKAEKNHTHNLDGKVKIKSEKITGNLNTLDESKISYTAKERVYGVNSIDELNAISLDPYHNGDMFIVDDSDGKEFYQVVDETKFGSEGGLKFKRSTLPVSGEWESVCYGKDKFVSLSSNSSTFVYSTDGITWTQGTLPVRGYWESVCYGNGKFVALQRSSIFLYSTDGITWTQGTKSNYLQCTNICYGKDKFIAISYVGENGTNIFLYSTDGITWTQGTLPVSDSWRSVCYGKDKFVAVTYNSSTFVYSTDGITWTQGTFPVSRYWYSVCYGKDKFVAVAQHTNIYVYSTDGITWTQGTLPVSGYNRSVCYGNNKFVAVANNNFIYSTDGITWTRGTLPTTDNYEALCYGKDKFVCLSYDGNSTQNMFITSYSIPIANSAFVQIPTNDFYEWSQIKNLPNTLSGYGINDAITKSDYTAKIDEMNSYIEDPGTEIDLTNTVFTDNFVANIVSSMDTIKSTLSTKTDTFVSKVNNIITIQ